jgi:hypothetical protein
MSKKIIVLIVLSTLFYISSIFEMLSDWVINGLYMCVLKLT